MAARRTAKLSGEGRNARQDNEKIRRRTIFSAETMGLEPDIRICQSPWCFNAYKIVMLKFRHHISEIDKQDTDQHRKDNLNLNINAETDGSCDQLDQQQKQADSCLDAAENFSRNFL